MEKKINIVLDTSIFVNPDGRYHFGQTTAQALTAFINIIETKPNITCYMPPSTMEELSKFIEETIPENKMILIKKQPPASYVTTVPALFVYEFIDEMRARINKGLRIAEKYARKNHENDDFVKTLRDEYRGALREGFLDSKEDFDSILLAKELDAYIATCDQGLVKWAQKLGIPCLIPQELKALIIS
jgi:RNA ligase partner protein